MGVSTVTPSLTRQTIRGNVSSYNIFGSTERQDLLSYCLSDGNYSDLRNLALLPMADGSFASFQSHSVYICTNDIPRDLLPNLDHYLVDLSEENSDLHDSLLKVASSPYTQLQCLSVQTVANLLRSCMPAGWQSQQTVSLPSGSFPLKWFQAFWEWLRVHCHNLHHFDRQLLVPVSTGSGQRKFNVTRLSRDSAVVYLPTSASCHPDLRQALTKLQVKITDQNDFPYVSHPQLLNYLYKYTADDVLSAIACVYRGRLQYIQNISLTGGEANALLFFLSSLYSLSYDQNQVLCCLSIFTALQQGRLFSIRKAAELSWGGKAVVEPQALDISHSCLPPNLIVLSRSRQVSLLIVTGQVETPSKFQFVLNILYPMIRSGDYPASKTNQVMVEVLRLIPVLKAQLPRSQSDKLVSATGNLSFIKTANGTRKSPKELFDPSIPDLNALYQGEPVFPLAPFDAREFRHCLRRCGLQTSIQAQQAVSVIESISMTKSHAPRLVGKVTFSRSKALLRYLSSCSSQFFDEMVTIPSVFSGRRYPLSEAISILSPRFNWLPVCSEPPDRFPSCLTWKGKAYTSHLVSLTSGEVLLPTRENHDTLPCITGSQMYVVDCNISSDVYGYLTSSVQHYVMPRAIATQVWKHFKLAIQHCREMDVRDIDATVVDVYGYMDRHGEENSELFTANWIWIRKHHTFVCPKVAALDVHPTFPRSLEPYLYVIPEILAQDYSELFTRHNVQEEISQSQIVSVLGRIKAEEKADVDGMRAMSMVLDILKWLTSDGQSSPDLGVTDALYVPIQTSLNYPQLVDPEEAVYTENAILQEYLESSDSADEHDFVDHRVSAGMARMLGVAPLSEHLHISEDTFEDVGQHEPLITRLKNILEDYRDGVTIVKELLQNADDAGATEVNICYDARTHSTPPKSLFFAGMAQSHGPALVVHNNASFSKDDFLNITKLAGETKMNKPLKIGKLGVGVCSVYHITDIPSFVSQDMLYIFDPTMSHLGKDIRDPARPGKKIRFTNKIIVPSKQLMPYEGLYGFDKRMLYNGTIFRFPFRTSPSDISSIMYNERTAMKLLEDICHCSSQLLLFLQNVKRVTFSRVNPGEQTPRELLAIRKSTTTLLADSPVSIHSIAITCQMLSSNTQDHWLVATYSDDSISFGSNYTYATASVACQLNMSSTPTSDSSHCNSFVPQAVKGEIFCFLPLAVHSGLPVHVSSNFAVMKSRRGIQASSDSSDPLARFNAGLMEHIIPRAYCNLLETLKNMCMEGQIPQESYRFFSLWPLIEQLQTHNPWDKLIAPLYKLISSSELFFSGTVNQWLTLSQSEVLAPGILSTRSDVESIPSCVVTVLEILQRQFVDVPERYRTHLPQDKLEECILDERRFVEVFFSRARKLQHTQDTRNEVLKHLLRTFGDICSQDFADDFFRQEYLKEALQINKCVPCTPDGTVLKHCKDVVDPSALPSKLYDPDDQVFPVSEFCRSKLIHGALSQLGMVRRHMPWHMLAERARTVQILFSSKQTKIKALERAQLIIECIKKNLDEHSLSCESGPNGEDNCEGLDSIPFFPVMKSPKDYPLQWRGDSCELLSGKELLHCSDKNMRLAGSQLPVVCDKSPKDGGCGMIPLQVRELLGIRAEPSYSTAIEQLYCLSHQFASQEMDVECSETLTWIEEICSAVYSYLNALLEKGTINNSDLGQLRCQSCVWTGEHFVSPNLVAKKWSHEGPYLYSLPSKLRTNQRLADALEIRETFEPVDFVTALECMYEDFSDQPVSDRCLQSILVIVQKLDTQAIHEDTNFYLPDENSVMCLSSDLVYNDAPWCQEDEEWRLVHRTIPMESAVKLGVILGHRKFLEPYESPMEKFAEPFGQHEPLTQIIKNILSQYPCDETVLKELLQNADDAKATKMYVILDKRTHRDEKIPTDEWADLQGPALLVWNDSVFTEKDLQGIQELGLGSKRSEEESIGQYGIGFNVVYNLTDCPSFITYCGSETLCVLDPHCRYVPGANTLKPGMRYNRLDDRFWTSYADLTTAYLREGVTDCPPELTAGGSLFRFPLRSTPELVEKSQLVDRDASKGNTYSSPLTMPMSARRMHEKLRQWAGDIKQALFFLNHVTEIRFFIIEDNNKMLLTNWYEASLSQEARRKRADLHSKVKEFVKAEQVPHAVCYPLTLSDRSPGMHGKQQTVSENWLIQQGVGDVLNENQKWKYAPQIKPKHGIAAPLDLRDFRGTVFCFLPLPLSSHLPVHVNGNFILNSSRRELWHSTKEDDPDDRTKWNKRLIEAIASSYVTFLSGAKDHYVHPQRRFNDIKELFAKIHHYYGTFPTWLPRKTKCLLPEGLLLTLAKTVFEKMNRENSPVMLTIRKVPVRDAQPSSRPSKTRTSPRIQFSVDWHPLHNEEDPSKQAYFWKTSEKELTPILESIGMKLSVAPMVIRAHFTSLDIHLPEANRETVFLYYSQFHSQVSQSGDFPCHISETAFRSVDRFQRFSQFLINMPTENQVEVTGSGCFVPSLQTKDEHREFPSDPFGLPLLLTVGEQLRFFDKSDLAICSEHHKIFPHSKDKFLHPQLLELRYDSKYFLQKSDDNWPLVRGILEGELPSSLHAVRVMNANTHINQSSVLRPLWSCLSIETVFSHHLKNVLQIWALLLSIQNQLFAFRSWDQLLPVVAPITRDEMPSDDDQYLPIFKVLQQAGMPVLDTSVVHHATASDYCPTFSHPHRVLTSLYYLHEVHMEEEGLTQLLSDRNADRSILTLFDYFKGIHFAQEEDSLRKLKCLPLFKDVSGQLRTLEGKAYIWPPHVCKVGSSKWLSETTAVFLKKDGAWTRLGVDAATVLGIEEIPVLKVYSEFIFPCFGLLTAEERHTQLEHIQDQLFDDADSEKKSKDDSKNSAAQQFINGLENLPCLPLPNGELSPVREFSDPNIPIFTIFKSSFLFPPRNLQTDVWLEFLRNIGLRKELTQDEFQDFCWKVSRGDHHDLKKASGILLNYLMKAEKWYTDTSFLGKVSSIPFVCPEPLPSLDWIKPVCPAKNRVQRGRKAIDLTCLNGAGLYRDSKELLVWTVKPVVKLPSFADNTERETKASVKEHLGVVTNPHPRDVVVNLKNISKSRFANFALFDKYTGDCKPQREDRYLDCLLVRVVEENFRFLHNCMHCHSPSTLDPIRDVPCIPVCSEGKQSGIRLPVLVRPFQVIAGGGAEVQNARPFINLLPHALFPFLQEVLFHLGVHTTMQPIHVRVALETIRSHVNQPLDPNTIEVVQCLLKRLYALLKDTPAAVLQRFGAILTPLYLPNAALQLAHTSTLICNDKHQYRKVPLDLSGVQYSLLHLLTHASISREDLGFTPRKLCNCLPTTVSPILLSSCCEEQLHASCTDVIANTDAADSLQRAFGLHVYVAKALQLILQHAGPERECSRFTASFQCFLQTTEIVVYRKLQADIFLTLVTPKRKIGTARVQFFIQKIEEGRYRLCLNHGTSSKLLKSLASSIVSCVAQSSGVNPKALGNPDEPIRDLLAIKSFEDIEDILDELDIPPASLMIDGVDIPISRQKPKLGDPIPPQWHHLLDQDINNIFRPEELVGYEERDDHIVLARVICRIPSEEEGEEEEEEEEEGEGKEERERIVQYLILTGQDDEEGQRVSVLDLYKFKRTDSTPLEDSHEDSVHDQEGDSEWKRIKKEICADLWRFWNLREHDKIKCIKRLYLKWHPDKNDHPLATRVIQFLKQQISRLEAGLPLDEDADEDEDYRKPSLWISRWNGWDEIAAQHCRTGQRGGGIDVSCLEEMKPSPDVSTAKVWLQQAEVDMRTMATVLADVDTRPDHAALVCFLAHEVAEKALKAGRYATSGLLSSDLMHHKLYGHAGALEDLMPYLTIGLRANAGRLESYYIPPRFPNYYNPPSVSADQFTPDQARDAHRDAGNILQMMRAVVGQAQEN